MSAFLMPSLGADMEAGTLVEWLKRPGDTVARGDIIAVVETQKGAIEIEIFDQGTVSELLVEEGTTVPVGTPLATINGGAPTDAPRTDAEPVLAEPAAAPVGIAPEPPAPPPPAPPPAAPAVPVAASGGLRASPAARRLAAERQIDLTELTGSGPGGAIVRADVERADVERAETGTPKVAPVKPARPAAKGLDMGEMRKAIAAAMARSKREIPHYYVNTTIDLTAVQDRLAAANAERPPAGRLLIAAPLLKATALALRKFPELNGSFEDGAARPSEAIHCGMAIALRGGGLIAPAIHDTDTQSLDELMAALRDLVKRARSGGLRSSELSEPTITVTSLGERGVEALFGVIYPPQVAIVGFGAPREGPWAIEGRVVARNLITVSLSADHRVSDGHRGALFLAEIDRLLQEPDAL